VSDQPQRLGALLGSFDSLSSEQREAIVTYLREAWIAQTGSAPGGFSVDLESLQRVFSPEVTPKSIRAAAQSLIAVPRERPNIPAELYLPVTSRAGFVTPEGRLLLELGDDREVTHLLDLTLRLVRFYGSTHRKVVARAVSIGGDLRPQTLGFYYFLLLNGCLGESHALMVPKDRRDERELATAVMRVAEAFSTSIGGSPVATRERTRLTSNWIVTEAHRQSMGAVRLEDIQGTTRCFVVESRRGQLLGMISASLAKRRAVDLTRVRLAAETAQSTYSDILPRLKSWGLTWERSVRDHDLCLELETAYVKSLQVPK